jgi:hypothetical protein
MERETENEIELVPQVGWDATYCEFVHEYSVIILEGDNFFTYCSIPCFSRSALSSELTSICIWSLVCLCSTNFVYSRTPVIRTLVIRIAHYPDRLGPSGKFVENSAKLTCPEITGYRIKHGTVLWLLELQIRRGRKF